MFTYRFSPPSAEWKVSPSAATGQLPTEDDLESQCRLGESVWNSYQLFLLNYAQLLPLFESLRELDFEDRVRDAHKRYGPGVAFLTSWESLERYCVDHPVTVLQVSLQSFTLGRVAWLEHMMARVGVTRMTCEKWSSQSWLDPVRTLVFFRDASLSSEEEESAGGGGVRRCAGPGLTDGAPLPSRDFEQFLDKTMMHFGQSELWLWRVVLEHHEQGWMLDGDRMRQIRRQWLLGTAAQSAFVDLPRIPWLGSSSSSPESPEDP